MKASILDLRYNMKSVLQALDRNESVDIFYYGKKKGVLTPVSDQEDQENHAEGKKKMRVGDHPFFGSTKDDVLSVEDRMNKLRKGRYDDL